MIKTVASLELPVGERLMIKKNSIRPLSCTGREKRFCIVTGTHGDELEGQYVCYELNRRIQAEMEHLKGIVEIYPALNPLGIDTVTRAFPMVDVDMNRIFPGTQNGSVAELMAAQAIRAGADLETARRILDTITTEEALDILYEKGLTDAFMQVVLPKVEYYLDHRAKGELKLGAILFSSVHGMLGETSRVTELKACINAQKNMTDLGENYDR